ncbi:MAG: DUF4115 domain-containing protein [Dehalococcoidia bacterium]|nr:DUF4115 domain-containing protein [Dehalococcoidia bacterium]
MASLGQRLREARERQGLSLEDIEVATRIRKSYLVAMEGEDYPSLPHPTYVKGFLKSYSAFLGIDPAEILDLYPERNSRPSITPMPKLEKPRLGGGFWMAMLALLVVVAGLAAFLYTSPWTQATLQGGGASTLAGEVVLPTLSPASAAISPSAGLGAAPVEASAPPTPTPAPQGVEVQARATANSWVWVIVDSTPVYTGTMKPGDVQTWKARDKVFMRIGNAGGLIISQNGQQRGALGNNGQVLDVQMTRDSMSFDVNPPLP